MRLLAAAMVLTMMPGASFAQSCVSTSWGQERMHVSNICEADITLHLRSKAGKCARDGGCKILVSVGGSFATPVMRDDGKVVFDWHTHVAHPVSPVGWEISLQ